MITLKSQESCDSILNKERWEKDYFLAHNNTLFADFDQDGNLKVFGYLHKKKKIGQWYYFTNNLCDSICMFKENKRTAKSYYFNNGEISLITFLWNNNKMDTCYNNLISKENYLTQSFGMDGCSQSAIFYYCNGIHKNYFPFNIAIDKIDELCTRIGGISKPVYSKYPSLKN